MDKKIRKRKRVRKIPTHKVRKTIGIPKIAAASEAQQLRKKGLRVRVIEVSKIHNLYDPFTDRGIKNVKIAQLSNSNRAPPDINKKIVIPKQEVLQFKNERKKLTKAKSLGKISDNK